METGEVPIKRLEPMDIAAYAKRHDKLAQLGARVMEILARDARHRADAMVRPSDDPALFGINEAARSLGLLGEGEVKP